MIQFNKTIHWEIGKLLELGVNEQWLNEINLSPDQIRDLLKGLLYLREMPKETKWNQD